MKKKLSVMLLVLIFVVMALPYMAFAYTSGLLNGQIMYRGSSDLSTIEQSTDTWTDDNEGTSLTLSPAETTKFGWYEFNNAVNITSYKIKTNQKIKVEYLSSDKTVLATDSIYISTVTRESFLSANNVKYVVISNDSGVNTAIYEFDVFGTASADTVAPANVTSLSQSHTDTMASFTWVNPVDSDFQSIKVYKNGTFLETLAKTVTSYDVVGLTPLTAYTYKFTTLDNSANESTGSSVSFTTLSTPDTTPPSSPTGLNVTAGDGQASASWSTVSDAMGYNVYVNGVKRNTTLISGTNYVVTPLTNGTSYGITVSAVDDSGNESVKSSSVSVTPVVAVIAPVKPIGLTVSAYNSALIARWSANSDVVTGYNLYVDGIKQNTALITSTEYNIPSLVNGTSYSITVTAVNSIGESPVSSAVSGTPSVNAIPLISLDFTLADVADGVANWFDSLWLVLAFSVAIPLSFMVAGRIKNLFG